MDEERETVAPEDGDADMETDKVDVSSHSRATVKNVLERKLSNRVPRQELMDKNILHGYTTSPVLHAQMSSLEWQKKNDDLQKKMRQRPDQDELLQLNILKNTCSVHSSLQANQTQLKRAVTANHLSQKIASRPGPLSLIQKGILDPINNCLVGAVKQLPLPGGEEQEEGSVTMIPAQQQVMQQKKRQQQRHSVATMGGWAGQTKQGASRSTSTSPFHSGDWGKLTSPVSRSVSVDVTEDGHEGLLRKGSSSSSLPSPPEFLNLESPAHSPSNSIGVRSPPTRYGSFPSSQIGYSVGKVPTISPKLSKKAVKSKREKFRFHIYQPPNQKRNLKDVPQKQRSPYSLLVQQQQILLQLQVLQQQHPEMVNTGINFPPIPADCSPQQHMQILLQTLHKMTAHENRSSGIPTSKHSPPFTAMSSHEPLMHKDNCTFSLMVGNSQQKAMATHNSSSFTNDSLIPCENGKKAKFEDIRVHQLKDACKDKKLVVSGKKADLIERLLEHNNGVLPSSVIDRKDTGPAADVRTTPQEPGSTVSTTSPVFKFPSGQPDSVTVPTRASYMHIKNIQDKFDEANQMKKLNYISGKCNYSGSIAPMPDTIPASFTVQQQQKLANQNAASTTTAVNSLASHTTDSHQMLIKKKSLSEPSSPTLSPSPSTLSLLTEMIGDNHSSLLNPAVLRQQLDGAKGQFIEQSTFNGAPITNGRPHNGSNPNLLASDDEMVFCSKATPAHLDQRVHRNSMPVLAPYNNAVDPQPATVMSAKPQLQSTTTTAAGRGGYRYRDGVDMYMNEAGDSSELMDIGNDPNLMGMLNMDEGGYQAQNSKAVTNSNLLDFLSMNNPLISRGSSPPPPYTSHNPHVATNPDMSWIHFVDANTFANYGAASLGQGSVAFVGQNLSVPVTVGAERFHNNEHSKSNLNSIQPFLDSDLPVPNLDLFSSADTEKFLSMSM